MDIQQTQVVHPASTIDDIALTATIPSEMIDAQQQLIDWCRKKVAVTEEESKELHEAYERAVKMKWKSDAMLRLHKNAVKKLQYYQKVLAALEAGLHIVPNFPIQMFAIRTKTKSPKGKIKYGTWRDDHKQGAQELPIGEGEYQNPFPIVEIDTVPTSEGEKKKSYPIEWDEMEFPITMAKPQIMDATSRAMALKIFDQIGVMPATRNEDPVIIGQIFRKRGYNTKIVSFLIAWHLDTTVI